MSMLLEEMPHQQESKTKGRINIGDSNDSNEACRILVPLYFMN